MVEILYVREDVATVICANVRQHDLHLACSTSMRYVGNISMYFCFHLFSFFRSACSHPKFRSTTTRTRLFFKEFVIACLQATLIETISTSLQVYIGYESIRFQNLTAIYDKNIKPGGKASEELLSCYRKRHHRLTLHVSQTLKIV